MYQERRRRMSLGSKWVVNLHCMDLNWNRLEATLPDRVWYLEFQLQMNWSSLRLFEWVEPNTEQQLFHHRVEKIIERKCPCSYAAQKDFVLLATLILPSLLISIFLFSPSLRSMAANNAEYWGSCTHSFTDHFSEYHTQALSFSKHKSGLVALITLGFLGCTGEMGFHYPACVKRSS